MNSIGLIIWGCKGGHRVFCSNGIVDYKQKAINDTIKDIRSFVRYNLINLTTYALEFTNDYKVFTIYRSCNDNGTGAYVAITVYIPHKQKVANLRLTLDTMMDSYFKEFIHPVFGTYYDGKYDDIELFSHYIQDLQVEDDKSYKFSPSVQDDKPHLMLYEDVKEVDNYFASPYRKEFFKCQEVMFMSMDLYNKRPETLRFNFAEEKIVGVSAPENLPQLYLGDNPIVKELIINNINVDKSKYHTINASTTNVTITLGRKYCKEVDIVGNVATLIEKNELQEKAGVIVLGSDLPLKEYIDYTIRFTVNQQVAPEQLLYIQEKGSSNVSQIKNSEIKINGSRLDKEYFIGIRPYPNKDNKLSKVHTFIPSISVANQKAEDIKLKTLQFTVNFDKKISDDYIYVYLEDKKINIKFAVPKKSGEIVKIFLPIETDATALTFDVDTGETEPKFDPDKKILYLSPKVLEFELYIPGIVKSAVQSWDFLILGKSKKKSPSLFPSGNSFKIKLNCNDNIKEGKLIINNVQYQYEVTDAPNPRITPLLLYVQLIKGNEESVFEYTPYGKEHGTVRTIKDSIFPYMKDSEADILFDEREYVKNVTREEKPIIIIQLGKKHTDSNSLSQININDAQEENGAKDVGKNEQNTFMLTFYGCAEFHTYGPSRDKIKLNDGKRLKMSSRSIDLFDKNEKRVFTIYKDEQMFTDELRKRYEGQDFSLKYTEEGCVIEYKMPKGNTKKWFESLRKRFWTILSLSLICLLTIVLGVYFWRNNPSIMACGKFIPITAKYGEKIEKIEFGDINYLQIDKTVINNETVYLLNILEAKDGENYNYEDSVLVFFGGVERPVVVKVFEQRLTQPDIKEAILRHTQDLRKVDTIEIVVPTPISITLNSLTHDINNMPIPVKVDSVFEMSNNYANMVKYSNLAVSEILNKAASYIITKEDYEAYVNIFKGFNTYNEYKLVAKSLEVLNKKLKQAEEDTRKLSALRQNANSQRKKLRLLSCSPSVVESVNDWYKALRPDERKIADEVYNFSIAMKVLTGFFSANRIDDVQALLKYKSYFGDEQYVVIQGFSKDTNHFKELQGKAGNKLEFSKSYEKIKAWAQNQNK